MGCCFKKKKKEKSVIWLARQCGILGSNTAAAVVHRALRQSG